MISADPTQNYHLASRRAICKLWCELEELEELIKLADLEGFVVIL